MPDLDTAPQIKAEELLADWDNAVSRFVKVMPVDFKKMQKKIFSRWLFFKIHIIRFEMHMDRPDKSENIFGISYKLSKHLTFYASSLISY